MATLGSATGYGNNSTARNVFAVEFASGGLSSAVEYRCFDNGQTYPAADTVETTTNEVFSNGGSSYSCICLVDTTDAAPASAWKPATPTAGEANPNRMLGNTNYVQQDGANIGAGGVATFNMVMEIDNTALTTDNMAFDIKVTYTYTGTVPVVTFQINTGTEGVPVWTDMTVGTHGILHTRVNGASNGYYANIPETGTEDTVEAHATTTLVG